MNPSRQILRSALIALLYLIFGPAFVVAAPKLSGLEVPQETRAVLQKIYSFDLDSARQDAQALQQAHPDHPLGYLLEGEAMWWKIWCLSSEYKYGMSYPQHRAKLESDQAYLDLAAKISSLADSKLAQQPSAEMEFYSGMGWALASRMYGLRSEARNTARTGIHAREHLLQALHLDPQLVDAYLGLGLYNYYVDTLGGMARMLRFVMGIPGGSKMEGIQQLKRDIAEGFLTCDAASFYLAINLHRYDQQYEKALAVMTPLAIKYRANPMFQLACGDLHRKLGHFAEAADFYRRAQSLSVTDRDTHFHIHQLAEQSLAAINSK